MTINPDADRQIDDYFRRQDEEKRRALREQLARQADEAARRGQLATALKTDDQAVVDRAMELGFTRETTKVMHLIPLVHVAWADGTVTARERDLILQAARAHGAAPGDEAMTFLATLLEERPAKAWLDGTHDLLRRIIKDLGSHGSDIVSLCNDVARASGGYLGFGSKISDDERKLIEQFSAILGAESEDEARSLTS